MLNQIWPPEGMEIMKREEKHNYNKGKTKQKRKI
jgi:hypothetical protein